MNGLPRFEKRIHGRRWALALLLAWPAALAAQCSDGTTAHLAVHHLTREASNSVDALAGTQTVGDYWETWNSSVSSTESINSGFLHYGSNGPSGYGGTAAVEWHDAPSSVGVGLFTTSNTHQARSTCGGSTSYSTYDSLSVSRPAITGTIGVWYLGGGADAANGYYNIAAVTGASNCGPSDTCNNQPYWSVTAGASKVSLSCSVCSSQSVTGIAVSNSIGDVNLVISIGGLTSEPFAFTVNTPHRLESAQASVDDPNADGYFSHIYYYNRDVFGNVLPSIALNEQFGAFASDRTNNWAKPTAGGISSYSGYIWQDQIYISGCAACTPPDSNPQSPLSTTAVDHAPQTWRVGSASVGSGASVQTNTFQRYVDHGRHTNIVSPTP